MGEMLAYESEQKVGKHKHISMDPLYYWASKRHTFPCLYEIALKILAVPATSVLSE